MQVIILNDETAVSNHAAEWVKELINKKNDAVLGLATGSTPINLYKNLVKMHKHEDLSFKDVTSFNLDEYFNINPENPQSYRTFMNNNLFNHVDIDRSKTHLPTCTSDQNPRSQGLAYEQSIKQNNGIDLQILGIGANGHIGFNEPTSSLNSRTRIKTLTKQTLIDNSRLFTSDEEQPKMAMTMGIATIMDSRYVLLMATGAGKAKAVKDMITGGVSAMCPASVLQMHENVVVIIDKAAAAELENHEYYQFAEEQNTLISDTYGLLHNY